MRHAVRRPDRNCGRAHRIAHCPIYHRRDGSGSCSAGRASPAGRLAASLAAATLPSRPAAGLGLPASPPRPCGPGHQLPAGPASALPAPCQRLPAPCQRPARSPAGGPTPRRTVDRLRGRQSRARRARQIPGQKIWASPRYVDPMGGWAPLTDFALHHCRFTATLCDVQNVDAASIGPRRVDVESHDAARRLT